MLVQTFGSRRDHGPFISARIQLFENFLNFRDSCSEPNKQSQCQTPKETYAYADERQTTKELMR